MLQEFGLAEIKKYPAMALSGGERRRCEIARALASFPSFILLDEPFAGVDPVAIRDIKKLILKLKNKGIGVLITDHNVRETLNIVDKAYIINEGVVFKEGTAEQIIKDEGVRQVYLGNEFTL